MKIGAVVELEEKYINQSDGLVTVSFQIPCHDWSLLKTSSEWHLVEKWLEEIRKRQKVEAKMMICPNCGNTEIAEENNFCIICGAKLRDACKCWVKKKDNYNCGESRCPGYGLFRIEKSRFKTE